MTDSSLISEIDARQLSGGIKDLEEDICDTRLDVDFRENAFVLFAWLTKALVVRSAPEGIQQCQEIIDWIAQGILPDKASAAIETIVTEEPNGYLTKKTFCVVKVCDFTYSRKRCCTNKNFFINAYQNCWLGLKVLHLVCDCKLTRLESQKCYLITMSHFLKNVPKQILVNEAPKVGFNQF